MFENTFIVSLIGFLIVLTPLVFIHELGHYLVKKKWRNSRTVFCWIWPRINWLY